MPRIRPIDRDATRHERNRKSRASIENAERENKGGMGRINGYARVMKSDIKADSGSLRKGEGRERELGRKSTRTNALVTSTVNLPTRKPLRPSEWKSR